MEVLGLALLALLIAAAALAATVWSRLPRTPTYVPLRTAWADDLDPECPLPEYPRPQLRRERWQNLNGRWELAITSRGAARPASFDRHIVVPFPVESALGGVQQRVEPGQCVWYRRALEPRPLGATERLLLHFGAVDWECEVFVDGSRVGSHRGGFDPFSFDITDALTADGPHELLVAVRDPTDTGPQPVGKQALKPRLISYTAVTGIWQTVWLEPVPAERIERVCARATLRDGRVAMRTSLAGAVAGDRVEVVIRAGEERVAEIRGDASGGEALLEGTLADIHPWSPDDPFLYDLEVALIRDEEELDRVGSYFGAREIAIGPDPSGVQRILLNGAPVFQLGPLDQGWWPDGLYTAPSDEALAFDIEATKRMGFNMIRKHVKVEPARWYWHADRLGVLVWQDMPSGDGAFDLGKAIWDRFVRRVHPANAEHDLERTPDSAAIYYRELDAMLDALDPFPCIVAWVPFNEAWGQFDTDAVLEHVAAHDPGRLVDGPSGWKDTGSGQLRDYHMYQREAKLPPLGDRPLVYGEFGGLGLKVDGHRAVRGGWGYVSFETPQELEAAYVEILETIEDLVTRGLSAAVYTQTTDVEGEINGLLTYDRAVFKIAPEILEPLHRRIIQTGRALA